MPGGRFRMGKYKYSDKKPSLAKTFILNQNTLGWEDTASGTDHQFIPLLAFNYTPELENIYVSKLEFGEIVYPQNLSSTIFDDGFQYSFILSGGEAKDLHRFVFMRLGDAEIDALMAETLQNAPLDDYDMEENLGKWSALGKKVNGESPYYPYAATASFDESIAGEDISGEKLCCLNRLQNINFGETVEWEADLPSLTSVPYGLSFPVLERWSGKMPNLETGSGMFAGDATLQSFTGNLSSLSYGYSMFEGCASLDRWETALPKLVAGDEMFRSTGMEEWNANLPNLLFGRNMFDGTPL